MFKKYGKFWGFSKLGGEMRMMYDMQKQNVNFGFHKIARHTIRPIAKDSG